MTTTITPSLGHGALMSQQGVGTSPGYDAIDVRRMTNGDLQEGVLNASDFMVVQRAAGANMSVDIGMPAGGAAYVQGDTVSGQGLYTVPSHSATINETITAANATNPRVDQIILEILDNVHDASGSNLARTRVLTGTATAGATLANRTGALALPGNALLLADVLVGAAVSSVDNTKIRDRRKFARGAHLVISRLTNAGGTSDYTIASSTFSLIDSTNLQPRIECTGAPVRVTLTGSSTNTVASSRDGIRFLVDGTSVAPDLFALQSPTAGSDIAFSLMAEFVPAAGTQLIAPAFSSISGTALLRAQAGFPLIFTVDEVVRQNTANNTSTSG